MKLTTFLIVCYLHSLIAGETSWSSHDNKNHNLNAASVSANDGFFRYFDNLADENNYKHNSPHILHIGHSHQKPFDSCEKGPQKQAFLSSLKRKYTKKISVATSINSLNVSQIFTETKNFSDYHPAQNIKRLPFYILNMVFLI